MNFGTYDIEQVIWKQIGMCKNFNAGIKGGNGKFVKDLAIKVMELCEANMHSSMKTEALARGIDKEDIALCEKVEKAFGFDAMPITPAAVDVYRWIAEREASGQRLASFVEWAKQNEGGKFIRMYRKDPSNIRVDWERAFQSRIERLVR